MAHLGNPKTNGQDAWEFYIKNNPNWKSLKLNIEKGVKNLPVLVKSGNTFVIKESAILKAGDSVELMQNTTTTIDGKRFAFVAVNNQKGFVPITSIRKPTKAGTVGTTSYETEVINSLNKQLKKIGHPITVIIKGKRKTLKIEDVVKAVKVDGTPKADIALVNTDGKPCFWLSHKAGGGAKAFQQYSGVTQVAGSNIYNHSEVQKFMKVVSGNITNNKLKAPMQMVVKDNKLINYAIFGPDFGKQYSKDNVHIIGQGDAILTAGKGEDEYALTFSDGMAVNGELDKFVGDYQAVLGATFREGRGFDYQNKQYKGARLGIYPIVLMRRTGLITVK